MAKSTPAQIKNLLRMAIKRHQIYIDNNEPSRNPHIVVMVADAKATIEAYKKVLYALEGNDILLKIDATGI